MESLWSDPPPTSCDVTFSTSSTNPTRAVGPRSSPRTYAEDVVWHEPDRVIRGRNDFGRRAEQLRAENPDWVFRPVCPASELDDVGHLGFQYGPAGQPPMASGMDIARTEDGVIIELYTIITEIRQPSSLHAEVARQDFTTTMTGTVVTGAVATRGRPGSPGGASAPGRPGRTRRKANPTLAPCDHRPHIKQASRPAGIFFVHNTNIEVHTDPA